MPSVQTTILVNFVEAHAVGHAIEGLRYALGHRAANPGANLSIVLNSATPVELARWCPFIDNVYSVPMASDESEMRAVLESIPREWDYVLDNPRRDVEPHRAVVPGFARYYDAAARYFRARIWRGPVGGRNNPSGYTPHQSLRLTLPLEARSAASRNFGSGTPRIALLPAGSSPRWLYPSATSWVQILGELSARYPAAVFCLLGKLTEDGRTTSRSSREEVARLSSVGKETIDLFDQPLSDQLAAVEACDLFISPHSGFGMAALSVGTPWLTISGGRWPEYFFNGVPFCSVMANPRFASYTMFEEPPSIEEDIDGEGRRAVVMTRARIIEDLSPIVEAAGQLIGRRLSYEEALNSHFSRLWKYYTGFMFSIDDIHQQYATDRPPSPP